MTPSRGIAQDINSHDAAAARPRKGVAVIVVVAGPSQRAGAGDR